MVRNAEILIVITGVTSGAWEQKENNKLQIPCETLVQGARKRNRINYMLFLELSAGPRFKSGPRLQIFSATSLQLSDYSRCSHREPGDEGRGLQACVLERVGLGLGDVFFRLIHG